MKKCYGERVRARFPFIDKPLPPKKNKFLVYSGGAAFSFLLTANLISRQPHKIGYNCHTAEYTSQIGLFVKDNGFAILLEKHMFELSRAQAYMNSESGITAIWIRMLKAA